MIEKITNQNQIARHKLAEKINELIDAVNTIQKEREAEWFEIKEWIGILEAVRKSVNVHEKQIDELQLAKDVMFNRIDMLNNAICDIRNHIADTSKNVQDRMIGCTTLDIPESYKNDQLTLATLDHNKSLQNELERIRKENEDKQAVLNCVVDMLKTLNQKYTLIMGKDVIKETVRLLEQTKGGDNE